MKNLCIIKKKKNVTCITRYEFIETYIKISFFFHSSARNFSNDIVLLPIYAVIYALFDLPVKVEFNKLNVGY